MKKSLGVMLAIGLAGLQFIAVLAVVFSSYVTSERALIKHARDLLRDVGINTIEHSKGFLSPAQGAAELAARLAQNRVIASDDPLLLEQLLFQQLQIAPQFAGAYFGNENGDFVMVLRVKDGEANFLSKIIRVHAEAGRTTEFIWRRDDYSLVGRQLDPADTYDPRDRPWYLKAKTELTTIWTDPYIFFTTKQPGITLASPVLADDGSVRGAVGVDIEISMISEFLSRLNIGTFGKALIINHNGDVIAHPNKDLIKTQDEDGTLRFASIEEIDDPLARAAFGEMARNGGFNVKTETPSQFVFDGASYVSSVMPIISDKLPWTIAVYAPEDDFTGIIKQNRTQNIWLAALVAALTASVGLALADYIYRPVRAFAVRTALISQGEIDPDIPPPATYRELEKANDALVQQIVARREAEREYGQTFNMSSRGMAQIDVGEGCFTRVNDRLVEMVGYTADELSKMHFTELVEPEDQRLLPDISQPHDAGTSMNQELRLIRKDGQTIWARVNGILIRDASGEPVHAVLTIDDVTQSHKQDVEITRLNRDLSHLARGNTMGQMAEGLAHELNQPLTAIAQNTDTALLILDQQPQADPELRVILTEIERESLRSGEIIRALRSFIRKDEGARTAFDFGALLNQTLHLVDAEARDAGVEIAAFTDKLPPVSANRTQVAQVLVNLLRNAIEAMAADRNNTRKINIRAREDSDQLLVCVEDTGPGIDPSLNLFAQFETTKPNGMGLGLSICRSIIEANGGRMWHEPGEHRGARFLFTLPLHHAG